MRLLVTGGCGFIGSHFINYYFQANPDVRITNLDAMYYCANEQNVSDEVRSSDRYELIRGNICSGDLLRYILVQNQIDTVIHFAAQSHVQHSFSDALQYTQDNVVGTHTLLESCRLYGKIKRFIHISTDEVYGESLLDVDEQKTEQSILCPTNPYAATKAAAELIAGSYLRSFQLPVIITRGNNVYGPNQYPEKLIPRFISLLRQDQPVTIQGDGTHVRAFLHVEDVCKAVHVILERGTIGELYNIGNHTEHTVYEVAERLIRLMKPGDDISRWVTYIPDRPFNDKRYYISNDKIKQLGWDIHVEFEKGLRDLVTLNELKLVSTVIL